MLSFVQRFVTKLCTCIKQFGIVVNKYVQSQEIKETTGSTHPVSRRPSGKYKHTKLIKFTKMKHFYFSAALAAMLFAACSTTEESVQPIPESAELGFASAATANLVTRADEGYTDLNANFKIYLEKTDAYPTAVNQVVTYTDGTGYATSPAVTLFTASRNLTAWAPATVDFAVAETPNVFTLTPGSKDDFVYQTSTAVNSGNCENVALKLNHAYAKLTFTLTTTNYSGAKSISSLVVKGTPGASTIDISTGEYATPTPADADLAVVSTATSFAAADANATALVVPKATGVALKLDCTLDGETYTNVEVKDIAALAPGANYNIKISITGTEMKITGVQIPNWTDGGEGSAELK